MSLKTRYSKFEERNTKASTVYYDFLQGLSHFIVPYLLFTLPFLWVLIAVTSKIGLHIMLAYMVFIIIDRSHENGGAPWQWYRNIGFYKWYSDYFPTKLVKESELDPSRNYMFGYHPHGLMAVGAYTCLGLNVNGFDEFFPGIKNSLLTLGFNFYIPFSRELFLRAGLASSSKKSIKNIYAKGPGYSCTVVVGGAAEALLADPGKADIVLKNRKGFVKVAIQNGADLVPCFGFGENHFVYIINPDPGSWGQLVQRFLKKNLGFYLPSWRGRLPWGKGIGHMFRSLPLTVVVGKPIRVEQDLNPSLDKIHKVHQQYLTGLKDLYDRNKVRYHPEPDVPIPELNFI